MIPDAALGLAVGFDQDAFRNAIKFAEQMGAPNEEERQVRFIRKGVGRTYSLNGVQVDPSTLRLDRDGKPLNPQVRMEVSADLELEADCAVEIQPAEADELPVGKFRPVKAVVTMLDVDYAKVQDCKEMEYNGDRYVYGYEPATYGLFGVDVHSMIFYALDES